MIVRWARHLVPLSYISLTYIPQQQQQTDLDTPPWNLKLEDAPPSAYIAGRFARDAAQVPAPQVPFYGPGSGYPYPYPYFQPPIHSYAPPIDAQPGPADPASPNVDNPQLFPFIKDWLKNLDEGPQGANGHGFSQYIHCFDENHIQHIFEIADPKLFDCNNIIAICPGMKIGTANLLLMYACKDMEAIQNEEHWRVKHFHYY